MSFKRSLQVLLLASCLATGAIATTGNAVELNPALPLKSLSGNMIGGIVMEYAGDKTYWLHIDYHYSGTPPGSRLVVKQRATRGQDNKNAVTYLVGEAYLVEGPQRVRLRLRRPDDPLDVVTQNLVFEIVDSHHAVVTSVTPKMQVGWTPAPAGMLSDPTPRATTVEGQLKEAIAMIDSDFRSAMPEAKTRLERILERDPKQDQAYLELARVAMKTNWSPTGWREAEALIKSAQQIRPDSVNAKILLGYVYVQQKREKEGLSLYEEAARAGTTNLWLWTNWGELLLQQGKYDGAVEKFRQVIKHPVTGDANDRARRQAYFGLLKIHRERSELDALEAVHKQRWAEHPVYFCYGTAYAHFLVSMRGDARAAEAVIKTLPPGTCEVGDGRVLMTLVKYVSWSSAKGPERDEALRSARITMPVSPELFRLLAESDHTLAAARQLVAAGEKIGMQDNHRMDALALAMSEGDIAAARRLISIGARPDALVGHDEMPVALLPVFTADLPGIALMQKSGVDYAKLRYRGATALEWARQQGDENVLKALRTDAKRL
jgi:tetratricopeptide (TPR) repeat protein